ncbi:MAG: T9SS type A sorting domain-containing protein, partial [Sphingobacteriales bacterium]
YTQNGYAAIGKYTEKIGGNWIMRGSFFPGEYFLTTDYVKTTALPTGNFSCYHDANTAIKITALACDFVPNSTLSIGETPFIYDETCIFPNPNSGQFTVKSGQPFAKGSIATLINLSGQKVYETTIPADRAACQISVPATLPRGMYVLRISQANGHFLYRKLMLRH